jgi:glycosyltransferase involved in cell wall biosynthesis
LAAELPSGDGAADAASPADEAVKRLAAEVSARRDGMAPSLEERIRLAELLAVDDDYEPAHRDFAVPRHFRLSILIPVYNEVATIRQVIARVAALPIPKEIIVIDDGSTDGTRNVLAELEVAQDLHVLYKPVNEGKGAAIRSGLRRARGDVVVIQDADLEYDPRDILALVRPIVRGEADVVYGSRFRERDAATSPWFHRLGNRLLTALSNALTGLELTDMETAYKALRRDLVEDLPICQPRFGFEPEITARIARRGWRLCEVPVRYTPRSYAQGKKIGWKDLFTTLYCILRYSLWD